MKINYKLLTILLVVQAAACSIYFQINKIPIFVDGNKKLVLASSKLLHLKQTGEFISKQGNLLDIKGVLISQNAGSPPKAYVNGKQAKYSTMLKPNDRLLLQKGPDVVEPLETIEKEIPHSVATVGKGPFIQIVEGIKGKEKILRGSISKKFSSSAIAKQPEPEKIQRFSALNKEKVVALTFDDGPSRYTVNILNVLKVNSAPATFFVVGQAIKRQPSAMRAIVAAGHGVGNHSNTHLALVRMSAAAQYADIAECMNLIKKAGGRSEWFRPPGGQFNYQMLRNAKKVGLKTVLWTADSQDWQKRGAASIAGKVLSQIRPGAVVLLHDGGGDRRQTIEALPQIISGIRSMGYKIVPLNQLLADKTSL